MTVSYEIPLSKPHLTDLEETAVAEAVRSGWISHGAFHEKAEELLKRWCRRQYCVLTSSGTMALTVAQMVLNVREGDRVAVPSMCFPGVAQTSPATYVMFDVDEFWQLSARALETDIPSVPGPKDGRLSGCIAVDSYGQLPNFAEVEAFCRDQKLWLIEDAAEAFGASRDGRPAGSFGDVSVFSFYGNKVITSGEGGALLTDDPIIYARAQAAVNFGRSGSKVYHDFPGTNGRMTELSAALLTVQLERATELLAYRRHVEETYLRFLSKDERPYYEVQPRSRANEHSPWLFNLSLPHELRDSLLTKLEFAGIEARPFFPVLSFHRGLKVTNACRRDTGRDIASRGICLPLYPGLKESQVALICDAIKGCGK